MLSFPQACSGYKVLLKEALQNEGTGHEKEPWEPTKRKDRGRGRMTKRKERGKGRMAQRKDRGKGRIA